MTRFQVGRLLNRTALVAMALCLGSAAASAAADSLADQGASAQKTRVATLASMAHDTGESPYGGVILARDGNFYGVSHAGGAGNHGTVFRVTSAGVVSAVYSFPRGGANYTPVGTLTQGSDGALYGSEINSSYTTTALFRVTLEGQFTQFQSFSDTSVSPLTLGRDGFLYGTTSSYGYGLGKFFRMSNTGEITAIASFTEDTLTGARGAPLEGDDGNFYMVASSGGSSGFGGILQVSPNGTVTTMCEFPGQGPVGGRGYGSLVYDAAHEYMWGQSYDDIWTNASYVFRYKAGAVEAIGSLGTLNAGQVAKGPDGVHFYINDRTTSLFSFAPGEARKKVAALPGKATGTLTFNSAGTLFGTTFDGGTNDLGTVYKVKGL